MNISRNLVYGISAMLAGSFLSACAPTTGNLSPPNDPAAFLGKSRLYEGAYTECIAQEAFLAYAQIAPSRNLDRASVKAQCAPEQQALYQAVWANAFAGRQDNIPRNWRHATGREAIKAIDNVVFSYIAQLLIQ